MNFFMWKQLAEYVYICLHRTIEYHVARIHAAVTNVDDKVLWCVRDNAMLCTALCF